MNQTRSNLPTDLNPLRHKPFSVQKIPPRAYRGKILHSLSPEELQYISDGGLLVNADGLIDACENWSQLEQQGSLLSGYEQVMLSPDALMVPGFVDLHVHLPQMAVTGCQEKNLLAWLERYIFPAEARFEQTDYARANSQWFFEELLRNGTTTAAVFLTSHDTATQIAFEAAEHLGNRVIMGQNLMDTNAPAELIRPAAQMLRETEFLCQHWHNRDNGRLQYSWMPRFALTSSEELLQGIGTLRKRYPDVYFHTHLSEQLSEIEAVLAQFPNVENYTHVYGQFGLLGPKTILAHGIHLCDTELALLESTQSSLAHCPSSNFFLKSGRFKLREILSRRLRMGLGSDVGAGPELSLFKTMKDAQFMQADQLISLEQLFYSATLGGAHALFQADRIGNFLPGKEADFLILNETGKPGIRLTHPDISENETLAFQDKVFGANSSAASIVSRLIYLGDDRWVQATFIRGRQLYGSVQGEK